LAWAAPRPQPDAQEPSGQLLPATVTREMCRPSMKLGERTRILIPPLGQRNAAGSVILALILVVLVAVAFDVNNVEYKYMKVKTYGTSH
jgi:hypothetical protein